MINTNGFRVMPRLVAVNQLEGDETDGFFLSEAEIRDAAVGSVVGYVPAGQSMAALQDPEDPATVEVFEGPVILVAA